MIRELFESILENYLAEKEHYARLEAGEKKLSELTIHNTLVKRLPFEFKRASNLNDKYLFEGSIGKGNIAEVPHLCVFDTAITTSAQEGYYIVYLFSTDMTKIYLTLEQAWTQYLNRYGIDQGKTEIARNTQKIRNIIRSAEGFSFNQPVLGATRALGKGYELGVICSKVYFFDTLPSDAEFIDDLRNLVGVYKELKGLVGTNILDIKTRSSEESFQSEIQNTPPEKPPVGPIARNTQRNYNGVAWRRNPKYASQAIENANYTCEHQSHHQTFISAKSGTQFVEAHHLIPMQFQDKFEYSLDVPENIIALCPNCHKAIHFAEVAIKKEMIKFFLEQRETGLLSRGIKIKENVLSDLYKNNEEFVE
ncbi:MULTISPECIES: MrcB family domain-containing protein [unclassified Chitinophaga]|uniref:MrcB family domain-containing protein n=1 Tax=unclassified Chitinophaga TaxID=2619133 RepID=UPI00300FB046